MKTGRAAVFFLLAVAFTSVAAQSAPTDQGVVAGRGHVTGTVVSSDGQPIPGVSIFVHSVEIGAVSDAAGRFKLGPFESERIVMQLSSIGFRTQQVLSEVPFSGHWIRLEQDVMGLNEVVVEAPATHAVGQCMVKIATMDVEQLDRDVMPSRIQALAGMPGVDLVTAGAGVLRPVIRGLSGLRVATLFRGARIESQAWGADHGIYLPEQGVDRVEVIRGPAALAIGSDALGGVLNFLPENPLAQTGRKSEISLRSFSATSGLQASLITRKRSRHAHHAFSGGYNSHGDYQQPDGSEVENSKYKQFFAQGVWGYIRDWGKIDGAYSSSYNTAGMIGSAAGLQQSGDHLITASVSLWKGGWKFKPAISYQLNHRKEYPEGRAEEGPDGGGTGGGAAPIDSADLDLSLRTLSVELAASSWREGPVKLSLGAQANRSTNEGIGGFLPDGEMQAAGLYGIATFSQNDWKLQAGGRADLKTADWTGSTEMRTFSMGSYTLGATFSPTPWTSLHANFAHGNRAPGLAELSADGVHHGAYRYEIGNPELGVERSHQAELSVDQNAKKNGHGWSWEVAVYRNAMQDFIHAIPLDTLTADGLPVFQYAVTDVVLKGGEIGLGFAPLRWPQWRLESSLSMLNTSKDLPLIPPARWRTELGWTQGKLGRMHQLFATVTMDCIQDYQLLHLACGTKIGKQLSIGISAWNILNTSYIPELSLLKNRGIVEPGRNLSLRLALAL